MPRKFFKFSRNDILPPRHCERSEAIHNTESHLLLYNFKLLRFHC
ncbi:hypothetical protein [Helicobacter rodentium]|nr:hypothetical protein [Helicobacter rodentium]